VIYSLLPAQMSNLHCEYSLSSGSRYGIGSSLQDFSSLFVRWTFICQYHEVILRTASKLSLATGQQTSTSLEHMGSDWHENHSPYSCCCALNLQGQQQLFCEVSAWSCT